MRKGQHAKWQKLTIAPEEVMAKLEPGMSIFLGTGVGEPRTLVKHLMAIIRPISKISNSSSW